MILTAQNINAINFWEGAIILLDKPYGFSSFRAVHQLRSKIRTGAAQKLKFGHAGTLDPLATGLLILASGKMTKKLDEYQAMSKVYSGRFSLGFERPSYDLETGICASKPYRHLTDIEIEHAKNALSGELWIKPPVHSAIKIDGKRAYKMARKGEAPVLEPRAMVVHEFHLNSQYFPEIEFRITCSKGTYIRSLAHEFGQILGCGAYLSSLRREAIGPYLLADSWNFSELSQLLESRIKR